MADDKKTLELQIRIATQEALTAVSSIKEEIQSLAEEAQKLSGADGEALRNTFQQVQAEAEKAAASINLFGSSSQDLRRVQAELKNTAVELVRNGFDPQSTEIKKLVEEYKKLDKAAGDIDKANRRNIESFGDLKNSIMRLVEVAAALKALSVIKDMGAFALKTADDFQTMRNQFGILLGDMEAGAGLFNEIKTFNDKTPFDMSTLTQATNVLIAAKVPLSELQSQLTKFGDLAQGNSQRLTSYVNAFSQAAAKGKADMQVLNTYLNQGVPILDALAKNFRVTTAEVVEMSSQGRISFEDFSRALDDLTAAGGQFYGGMALASESLVAMHEGLQEAVNSLAASYGDILMPAGIGVLGMFTNLTNAINDSSAAKGILAGLLTSGATLMTVVAGASAVMAAKTWLAYAAKMGLNAAMAVTNPLLWAGIAAAGVAAGAYVAYASSQKKAADEAAALALEQQKLNNSLNDGSRNLSHMSDDGLRRNIESLGRVANIISEFTSNRNNVASQIVSDSIREITARRNTFINELYTVVEDTRINDLNNLLSIAQGFLGDNAVPEEDARKLRWIIQAITADINALRRASGEIRKPWQEWFEEITGVDRARFGSSGADAARLYIAGLNQEMSRDQSVSVALGSMFDTTSALRDQQNKIQRTITELISIDRDNINSAFSLTDRGIQNLIIRYKELEQTINQFGYDKHLADLRKEVENLGKSERELTLAMWEANGATEDQMAELIELMNVLERHDILERYRQEVEALSDSKHEAAKAALILAGATREELAQFDEYLSALEQGGNTELSWFDKINSELEDWNSYLVEKFALALNDMEIFSDKAAVILGKLSAELVNLSINATLTGFEEFGRVLGQAAEDTNALGAALAAMSKQILQQLPIMFLQAGLQLIANGQWALGLGFIAASASSAMISGYVDGASKHAQGGVFDEYGKAARTFAHGGTFTNQIVSHPTYFRFGGGFGSLGLMGEAGSEAIMPLKRMPSGNLGVEAMGSGRETQVIINIINNSGAEVRREEHTDSGGNRQIDVIIGELVNNHINSGKADRAMGSRYGVRAVGV